MHLCILFGLLNRIKDPKTSSLQSFPFVEFLLQMFLQSGKSISKVPPTAPTDIVSLQIALSRRMPSYIVLCERKVVNVNKEGCREAIVMLLMFQARTIPVHGYDMDMQMVHGRIRVDPTHDLTIPIPPRW